MQLGSTRGGPLIPYAVGRINPPSRSIGFTRRYIHTYTYTHTHLSIYLSIYLVQLAGA